MGSGGDKSWNKSLLERSDCGFVFFALVLCLLSFAGAQLAKLWFERRKVGKTNCGKEGSWNWMAGQHKAWSPGMQREGHLAEPCGHVQQPQPQQYEAPWEFVPTERRVQGVERFCKFLLDKIITLEPQDAVEVRNFMKKLEHWLVRAKALLASASGSASVPEHVAMGLKVELPVRFQSFDEAGLPCEALVIANSDVAFRLLRKVHQIPAVNGDEPRTVWRAIECRVSANGTVTMPDDIVRRLLIVKRVSVVSILKDQPAENHQAIMNTFRREFHVQHTLTQLGHPNLVELLCYMEGGQDGGIYAVFPFHGRNLLDYVNQFRLSGVQYGIPMEGVRHLFEQMCRGIMVAHNCGFAHLDATLENFVVSDPVLERTHHRPCVEAYAANEVQVRVIDWGHAINLGLVDGVDGRFAPCVYEGPRGKYDFMAPELLHSDHGDLFDPLLCDVFSMGVCLFTMLVGINPMQISNRETGDPHTHLEEFGVARLLDYWRRKGGNPAPPSEAVDLVTRMMALDVSERISLPEVLKHPFLNSS